MDNLFVAKRYEKVDHDDYFGEILELVEDDDDIKDLVTTEKRAPNNIFLAFSRGVLVGVAWYSEIEKDETVVGVWVNKRHRNKGCAKLLVSCVDADLLSRNENCITAYSYSEIKKQNSSLLKKSGFGYSHSYVTMVYSDKTENHNCIDSKIVNYDDSFYEQMVDIRNNGISEAEEYYGEKSEPLFSKSDTQYRKYMVERKKDAFMIEHDGTLDAFVMVKGSEIMALNVRKGARGKGYAKALVNKCIEHLHSKRISNIELLCVDKNKPAYNLYKKLGFRPIGKVVCYKKMYLR